MKVTLDPGSGFCFGVVNAVEAAERELKEGKPLYCIGDLVHNRREMERLRDMGLVVIDRDDLSSLHGCKVLIRAHGEPPETYWLALKYNLELIDATCPVVLALQQEISKVYQQTKDIGGQVVIFGKPGHAEVIGLTGQTAHSAIIIENLEETGRIDVDRPVRLFAQTTGEPGLYKELSAVIRQRCRDFESSDTICRQVSGRSDRVRKFAAEHQVIIFVSGKESSNGKVLYSACREVNPKSYFVSSREELDPEWFNGITDAGVCGATSTPVWLMHEIVSAIEQMTS